MTGNRLTRLGGSDRWLAAAILLVHLALSVLYSVVVPLWEAHDEWAHYEYVEYVARNRALPPPGQRLTQEYEYDEATQPPLYYVLAALPVGFVDTGDDLVPTANPYATRGTGKGGVNFAIHDPRVEGFPWQGTVLAAHLARLMSVVIGTLGCLATYLLARTVWPGQPVLALGALTLNAFAPQYLFINSVITNDVLVTALGGWALYFAVRVMLEPPRGRVVLGLGLCTVLAVLTKYTALALLPLAFSVLAGGLWRTWRSRGLPRTSWRWLALGLAAATLLIGAWFWRNWQTTGHILPRFRRQIVMLTEQGLVRGLAWGNIPRLLRYGFKTFWASFGWGNLSPNRSAFFALAVLCGLAALGILLGVWRERGNRRCWLLLGLLLLDLLCLLALPLYQELRRGGVLLRGRYLLPALPAVALLLTWGLSRWLPRRAQAGLVVALTIFALAAALWVPWGLIRPAYAAPVMLTDADLSERSQPLGVTFDGTAELVAYDLWPEVLHPGEGLAVTVWWRALAPTAENYTVGVHLLGAGGQSYGSRNHYPGGGNFATSLWEPGDMFRETYWLETGNDVPVPAGGRVAVTLFVDDEEQFHLPVSDPQGGRLGERALFGQLPIRAAELASYRIQTPAHYTLEEPGGGRLALLGHDSGAPQGPLGRAVPLSLYWQCEEPVEGDYTVFVHLWDSTDHFVFGQDGPPAGGNYPTDLWERGETVQDERLLRLPRTLPLGTYQVRVGLYLLEGWERLATFDDAGRRTHDDAIPLFQLEVANDVHQGFVPYLLR